MPFGFRSSTARAGSHADDDVSFEFVKIEESQQQQQQPSRTTTTTTTTTVCRSMHSSALGAYNIFLCKRYLPSWRPANLGWKQSGSVRPCCNRWDKNKASWRDCSEETGAGRFEKYSKTPVPTTFQGRLDLVSSSHFEYHPPRCT